MFNIFLHKLIQTLHGLCITSTENKTQQDQKSDVRC